MALEIRYNKARSFENLAFRRIAKMLNKYFQEKMKHTTTEARIVYAKHILDGNRDKDVVENTRF